MKPVVIDSSVWIEWLHGNHSEPRAQARNRILYMPAIVGMELLSGARDRTAQRLIGDIVASFTKNERWIIPTANDFIRAGQGLAELGWPASRKSNDALIALCARQIGAELWTCDRDFLPLAKLFSVSIVKL